MDAGTWVIVVAIGIILGVWVSWITNPYRDSHFRPTRNKNYRVRLLNYDTVKLEKSVYDEQGECVAHSGIKHILIISYKENLFSRRRKRVLIYTGSEYIWMDTGVRASDVLGSRASHLHTEQVTRDARLIEAECIFNTYVSAEPSASMQVRALPIRRVANELHRKLDEIAVRGQYEYMTARGPATITEEQMALLNAPLPLLNKSMIMDRQLFSKKFLQAFPLPKEIKR